MASILIPKSAETTSDLQHIEEAAVRSLATAILEVLEKHYPKYAGKWNIVINTDPKGGIVQVRNLLISGKYGFQLPITWLSNYDDLKKLIMQQAGELLERHGLSRDFRSDVEQELHDMKRDYNGEAQPDV